VTKQALRELYKEYIYEEQKFLFAPWKLLRAIDMSAVGGLNYNDIETLRSCEELNPYNRGLLPSQSQIQKLHTSDMMLVRGIYPWKRRRLQEVKSINIILSI
jgi:hypothetical protein